MAPCVDYEKSIKLAAVQMSPVFLNKQATTDKVCDMIIEAGKNGADVIGFPECIIPGYPGWGEMISSDGSQAHSLYKKLFLNSVEVPGPEVDQISRACKEAKVYAVVGVNERRAGTFGTTWNTQLLFDRNGVLLNKHQKFVPTLTEKLIHHHGTTGAHVSAPTEFGELSGFICGENVNLLAGYALSLKYPVVHVASWPPHFNTELDMQTSILNCTRGLAYSLKCYLINSCSVIGDDIIEAYGQDQEVKMFLESERRKPLATIVGPTGEIIAGPLEAGDGILYAEVTPSDLIIPKYVHDIAGHYQRPELFAPLFASHFEAHNSRL